MALFAGALLIYFYAHYGFASITTHLLAMYSAGFDQGSRVVDHGLETADVDVQVAPFADGFA